MKKLKCIVIDDDPTITDLVHHFCDKHDMIEYCVECNHAVDGLKLISNGDFDLVFLDYNMPQLTGQDVLQLKQDESKIVMITSEVDFAVESYRYSDIIDYLLKPISYDRFAEAIDKMNHLQSIIQPKVNDKIMVKDGNKWVPVELSDILYVKSESNYSTIYTHDHQIMTLVNLKDLQSKLPPTFIRSHRSYIINTTYIDYITKEEVSIKGKQIPISASYRASFKDYIQQYD